MALKSLTLNDLKLALPDFLGKRLPLLQSTATGSVYVPMLVQKRDAIDKLPPALLDTRPLAEKLRTLDTEHDGFGAAIYHYCESYSRLPQADPATLELVETVRKTFVPQLGRLNDSYATEAQAAQSHDADVTRLGPSVAKLPVPGGTLLDWVKAFVERGVALHDLLSQRADVDAAVTAQGMTDSIQLRSTTLGLLGRLRASVADEVSADPKLPRNLEVQLFGYFDELNDLRASRKTAKPGKPA